MKLPQVKGPDFERWCYSRTATRYFVFYSYITGVVCRATVNSALRMFEQQGWTQWSTDVIFIGCSIAQLNSVSLQPDVHCMFSQIETLVKLLLLITVVGHTQNALKLLKTHFRNSRPMNQERLNQVAVLRVHQKRRGPIPMRGCQ